MPRRQVEQGAALARDLAADPETDGRLLHGNLHYRHVLAASREPWLVISPKPVSGDPHAEVAPLLWHRWPEVVASGDVRAAVRARFLTVVDTAGLDEDRARDWVIIRCLALALRAISGSDGRPDVDEITRAVTVTKAVQE